MSYESPTQSDYMNTQALNHEFLRLARLQPSQFALSNAEASRLRALGRWQTERLAAAPFLLCTIREDDLQLWRELLQGDPNSDLFRNDGKQASEISNLVAATAGFLWQLVHKNTYAVRLISAAQSEWCELITEVSYFELVSTCRHRGDLLSSRQADGLDIWNKLLQEGVRPENDVRTSAHVAALQSLLICNQKMDNSAWQLAACAGKSAQLRVAECAGSGSGG